MKPDDLKDLSDAELAHVVIMQLAVASAVLANCFRDRRRHPKPFKPEEFMIQLRPKAQSLRESMELVREWAKKVLPAAVEAQAKAPQADEPTIVEGREP